MAFYLKIKGIDGGVTAKGFEKAIELASVNFGVGRSVATKTGAMFDRQVGTPTFRGVTITKKVDKATPYLFTKSCGDTAIDQVVIEECRGENEIAPFATYTLSDVIISSYENSGVASDNGVADTRETLQLNYSKVEIKVKPKNGSPVSSGFDLEKATSL